jgi:hypothetical protein
MVKDNDMELDAVQASPQTPNRRKHGHPAKDLVLEPVVGNAAEPAYDEIVAELLEFTGKPDHLLSFLPVCIECRRGFRVSNPHPDLSDCGFDALDFTREYGTFLV